MTTPAGTGPAGPAGPTSRRPTLILFDVNETLSDMSPLAGRFEEVGAPGHLASTWFAGVLRDGFALAAAGATAPFSEVAAGLLQVQLAGLPLDREPADAVDHVMSGFQRLELHPDVPAGITALASLGLRLATLSNGSAGVAADLLDRAGLREHVELLLSVEDAGAWKPAARSYRYALDRCQATAEETMLVAVHPWDVDGASRAGLRTAWLNRTGAAYPTYFSRPDLEIAELGQLADALA